jgi:hypothetical protein
MKGQTDHCLALVWSFPPVVLVRVY